MSEQIKYKNFEKGYGADEIRLALVDNIEGIRFLFYGNGSENGEDLSAKLKFYNEGLAVLVQEIQKSKVKPLTYDAIALTKVVDAFDNAIFNEKIDHSRLSDDLDMLNVIYAKYAHFKNSTSS